MPSILHVEVVEQAAGALQLRLWRDNPGEPRTQPVAPAEIADLIRTAEASYYGPAATNLRHVGQRLFRWLDGGERRLTAEIEAAAYGADVLVLAIAMPHGLAHLPWEVLHDGRGFLVHALNPAVLPVRWRPAPPAASPPANRPLQLLFMAASPQDMRSVLDYEREEHEILTATRRWPLDLTVEESGCLEELGELVWDYGEGFFDVLHLAGHADHAKDGTPVFFLEDPEGRRAPTTALELARTLPHRLPLVFLSGCRTGQNAAYGEVRSLAEQLVEHGFRMVLGWGSPVRDRDATLAARHLYQQLSAGVPLVPALVRAHARLQEDGVRDWHLLRLFCAGEPPGAFVTPLRYPDRRYSVVRPAEFEFLDPLTRTVKVATRAGFVGRRRLLQASIRTLRLPEAPRVGRLLHGQGGRGKSSVAARLCERLRREFQRVVVIGRLDEPALVNAWARELLDDDARRALRDPAIELLYRIEATLRRLAAAGHPAPLFVLDDFEQNQPRAADGDLEMAPRAQAVLVALAEALDHTGVGRVLVTGRYALPPPFDLFLEPEELQPLDATEQQKQLLRLEQRVAPTTRGAGGLLDEALLAADGNPRLFEWLHSVLRQPGLDHAAIVRELRQAEERFREDILARRLIASLPEETRVLLARLLLLNEPVPLAAVRVLAPAQDEAVLRRMLGHAADLSLLDIRQDAGEPHYRVPRQLDGGDPPLLPVPGETERAQLAGELFEVLYPRWWTDARNSEERWHLDEKQVVELIRLGATSRRRNEVVQLADWLTTSWNNQYRYREVMLLLEEVIPAAGRHHTLLLNLARAVGALGNAAAAGEMLNEALARCPPTEEQERSAILFHLGDWMIQVGRYDEAVQILREELLPASKRAGDTRQQVAILGRIADVLALRGELDEALRIYREEMLPASGQPGGARDRAITLGRIADVLEMRGEYDQTLRIRREEELPIYERLGDVRSRTGTLGKIADVLVMRGELDEALRIFSEDVLPVFVRLGDVRMQAATLSRIADVMTTRGELDEALRIRREESLPIYERLGDVRSKAQALGKIADVMVMRGEFAAALRIRREEELLVYEHLGDVRERARVLGKIARVLVKRGETDEALRLLREEILPAFDQLGDVRERAVALGTIAEVLADRGEMDEALRILRDELLPVWERLGDERSRAVTLGRIADDLAIRGDLVEALRIRREEELPVYKRLGDVHLLIVGRVNLALLLITSQREEDFAEAVEHLTWSYQAAVQRRYAEAEQVAELLEELGIPVPTTT